MIPVKEWSSKYYVPYNHKMILRNPLNDIFYVCWIWNEVHYFGSKHYDKDGAYSFINRDHCEIYIIKERWFKKIKEFNQELWA